MELFALIEITKEQPPVGAACVLFVPYLGFTSAIRFDNTYQSTITRQRVEPTHWMKPLTFSQVLEGDLSPSVLENGWHIRTKSDSFLLKNPIKKNNENPNTPSE